MTIFVSCCVISHRIVEDAECFVEATIAALVCGGTHGNIRYGVAQAYSRFMYICT